MNREPRDTVLQCKTTRTNRTLIDQAAVAEGKTTSTYIQDVVLAHAIAVVTTTTDGPTTP